VSGAAAGSIRLGLSGALLVAMAIGSTALAMPTGSAEGCAWKRHSKPVVKQVRRHGRLRRVKRVKHWWTCDARPAGLTPAAIPPPPGPGTPPAEEPKPQASYLGVKAVEWSYTLSRPEVVAGEVTVELNNQGEDAHNLKLQREGSGEPPLEVPEAGAGAHTSARFTLSPGSYRLYCSLLGHDANGMHATLAVAGD
jgi:plastocyanin